jgi:hypothetical protein
VSPPDERIIGAFEMIELNMEAGGVSDRDSFIV